MTGGKKSQSRSQRRKLVAGLYLTPLRRGRLCRRADSEEKRASGCCEDRFHDYLKIFGAVRTLFSAATRFIAAAYASGTEQSPILRRGREGGAGLVTGHHDELGTVFCRGSACWREAVTLRLSDSAIVMNVVHNASVAASGGGNEA